MLTIFGLNPALRTIVVSLCKLYRYRDRSYRVIEPSGYPRADIVIVDADDDNAVAEWRRSDGGGPGKPAVLIGADYTEAAEEVSSKQYRLKRTRLSAHLLKTLHAITVKELKYVPELVIGREDETKTDGAVASILGQSSAVGSGENGMVLVVDDSLSVRTQMDMALRLHDLSVDMAEDAEEALELVDRNSYDVIFLDIVLPEMDGYKACKLIKANSSTKSTPVVMLTGKTSTFNKVRGVMAGCDRYLTKPVDAEELRTVLQEYIPELKLH